MGAVDFRINSKVRSVLARHWIDLTRVGFLSTNGTVRLSGSLHRISSESDDHYLAEYNLMELETAILRIREVKRVYFDLDNWRRDGNNQWHRKERATPITKRGKEEDESEK